MSDDVLFPSVGELTDVIYKTEETERRYIREKRTLRHRLKQIPARQDESFQSQTHLNLRAKFLTSQTSLKTAKKLEKDEEEISHQLEKSEHSLRVLEAAILVFGERIAQETTNTRNDGSIAYRNRNRCLLDDIRKKENQLSQLSTSICVKTSRNIKRKMEINQLGEERKVCAIQIKQLLNSIEKCRRRVSECVLNSRCLQYKRSEGLQSMTSLYTTAQSEKHEFEEQWHSFGSMTAYHRQKKATSGANLSDVAIEKQEAAFAMRKQAEREKTRELWTTLQRTKDRVQRLEVAEKAVLQEIGVENIDDLLDTFSVAEETNIALHDQLNEVVERERDLEHEIASQKPIEMLQKHIVFGVEKVSRRLQHYDNLFCDAQTKFERTCETVNAIGRKLGLDTQRESVFQVLSELECFVKQRIGHVSEIKTGAEDESEPFLDRELNQKMSTDLQKELQKQFLQEEERRSNGRKHSQERSAFASHLLGKSPQKRDSLQHPELFFFDINISLPICALNEDTTDG